MTSRVFVRLAVTFLGIAAVAAVVTRAIPAREPARLLTIAATEYPAERNQGALPPSESDAVARLNASPRHGEWATVQVGRNPVTGGQDSTRVWVVYPQRSARAPVVIVVHEIFGLTPWVRSVADQLAADGFIAVAPDFLTMKNVPGNPADGPDRNQATAAIQGVTTEEVNRQIAAAAKYAMALPAAIPKYGVVGFCWGGSASFLHASNAPNVSAAVVYYGTSPDAPSFAAIRAPVLGLYGGSDARVNATVPRADSAMKSLGKPFTVHTFDGAGHGFLKQSNAQNLEASTKAWPLTVQFFRTHLEGL